MESYAHFALLCSVIIAVEAEYCGKVVDKEFYCEEGHCCGDRKIFKCCTYYRYYEMWWFWLLWCVIILLGCTCAYYRRNHIGPYGRLTRYWYTIAPPVSTVEPDSQVLQGPEGPAYKLPSYEEVIEMPQLGPPEDNEGAPPPYVCFTEEQNNNSGDNFMTGSQLSAEAHVTPEDSPPEYTPTVVPQCTSNL